MALITLGVLSVVIGIVVMVLAVWFGADQDVMVDLIGDFFGWEDDDYSREN